MMFSAYAHAAIIDVGSTIGNNTVSITLDAGTYNITQVGTTDGGLYNAWNAWGDTFGCDINGENCTHGWLNSYHINSSEFSTIDIAPTSIYADPLLALANNSGVTSFTLSTNTNVSFTTVTSFLSDNVGGISLDIQEASSVPAPTILWLLGIGGVGLISAKRKLFGD